MLFYAVFQFLGCLATNRARHAFIHPVHVNFDALTAKEGDRWLDKALVFMAVAEEDSGVRLERVRGAGFCLNWRDVLICNGEAALVGTELGFGDEHGPL